MPPENTRTTLRPVRTPRDIAAVAALGSEIWHEAYAATLSPAQINYMVEKFQSAPAVERQMREEGYEYFLIETEAGPAGYVGFSAQAGRLFLSKFYLLAAHRGARHTDDVFAFLYTAAARRGCHTIWLTVNRHNARAIAAYEKRGFATVREEVADIGGGYVMDDYIMEKNL